jgi:RNA polymerase sigma-54 factor
MTQEFAPQLVQKVSPRLVLASHILQLSSLDLQQAIRVELDDNPAMEMIEKETCSVCGGGLQGSICPHCLARQKQDQDNTGDEWETGEPYTPPSAPETGGDAEFDPMTQVATPITLGEKLLLDLRAMLPPEDMRIAEYLVGSLDENGYLAGTIERIALEFGVPPQRVAIVLKALQSLDPVGIGASDLRECLLLQLDYLAQESGEVPLVREIVSNHLQALAEHKFHRIAAHLGVTGDAVAEAAAFIRQRLNPYPAGSYTGPRHGGGQAGATFHVMPDVIISKGQDGFEVEVSESKRFVLRVAPQYRQLHRDMLHDPGRFSAEEQQHIRNYVSRARLFIDNINQRRQTLYKISSYIVEAQKDFLESGVRHLRPLTRAGVAAGVGLHESTISRATAAKYAMLPNRKVIPFADFFQLSLSTLDVIKEMIEKEPRPLADQEIADKLADRGINIARRTVAKYRGQLRILPSPLR